METHQIPRAQKTRRALLSTVSPSGAGTARPVGPVPRSGGAHPPFRSADPEAGVSDGGNPARPHSAHLLPAFGPAAYVAHLLHLESPPCITSGCVDHRVTT